MICWAHLFTWFAFASGMVIYMGHAVAQLVEALRYKQEGHGFDT
jgi:hypothetical protein